MQSEFVRLHLFALDYILFCTHQRRPLSRGAGAKRLRGEPRRSGFRAPLPGADSPYQGEMSRRDKGGRDAGAQRLRGCCRFATADASGGPIFSVLPEKIGEKRGAWKRLVLPASKFRQVPMFQASFHPMVILRGSAARRLIRGCRICSWLP